MKRILVFLPVVIFLALGCAISGTKLKPVAYSHEKVSLMGTGGSQSPEVFKEYISGYEAVWNATVETIQEVGHPIVTVDKNSGTLTTDWLERGGAPFILGMPFNTFKDRFTVRFLKLGDSQTKVGVRRSLAIMEKGQAKPQTSNGVIEGWLLDEIGAKLATKK